MKENTRKNSFYFSIQKKNENNKKNWCFFKKNISLFDINVSKIREYINIYICIYYIWCAMVCSLFIHIVWYVGNGREKKNLNFKTGTLRNSTNPVQNLNRSQLSAANASVCVCVCMFELSKHQFTLHTIYAILLTICVWFSRCRHQ